MNPLYPAALEMQNFCVERGWKCCLIGGLADVEGILIKQREVLDWDYINRELAPLCELKEAPEILEQLEKMRRQIEAE